MAQTTFVDQIHIWQEELSAIKKDVISVEGVAYHCVSLAREKAIKRGIRYPILESVRRSFIDNGVVFTVRAA